jgi:hypothetical protein
MASLIDPVFWPEGIAKTGTINFKAFIFSLAGSKLIVWGVILFFIAHYGFRKKEKWTWMSILIATVLWFSIDETFSICYKVYGNAIGNIFLLLLLVLPLGFTFLDFFQSNKK